MLHGTAQAALDLAMLDPELFSRLYVCLSVDLSVYLILQCWILNCSVVCMSVC